MASWLAGGAADEAWPAAAEAGPPLAAGEPLEQAASTRPAAAVIAARVVGYPFRHAARLSR
jgi:hypothetical protein